MTALHQSPFLYALGWAIASSLWQMALLWLIYQLGFNIYRSIKPSLKHLVSSTFLVVGFIWFCISLVQKYQEQSALLHYLASLPAVDDPNSLAANTAAIPKLGWGTLIALGEQYLPYLSAAYLLVLLFLSVRLISAYMYTQQLKTSGLVEIGDSWNYLVETYRTKIGISKKVKIYLSQLIDVPATLGYIKPVILLPLATFNHLSIAQVEAVLIHELSHIRRNDYLINIIVSVIETILFFNPFANLLANSLKKERENCCDDIVLQFQCDPHSYASALLSLEKLRMNSTQLAVAATGNKNQLLGRVKRILNVKTKGFNYGQKLLALFAIAFILTSLAWLTPPESPVSTNKQTATIDPSFKKLSSISPEAKKPTLFPKRSTRDLALNPPRKRDRENYVSDEQVMDMDHETGGIFLNEDGAGLLHVPAPKSPGLNAELDKSGIKMIAPSLNGWNIIIPPITPGSNSGFSWNFAYPEEYFSNMNFSNLMPQVFDDKMRLNKNFVMKLQLEKIKKTFREIDWKKIEQEWKQSGEKIDWADLQQQVKDAYDEQISTVYDNAATEKKYKNSYYEYYVPQVKTPAPVFREAPARPRVTRKQSEPIVWSVPASTGGRKSFTMIHQDLKDGKIKSADTRNQELRGIETDLWSLFSAPKTETKKENKFVFSIKSDKDAYQPLLLTAVNAANRLTSSHNAKIMATVKGTNTIICINTNSNKKENNCDKKNHKAQAYSYSLSKKSSGEASVNSSNDSDDDDDN